MIKCVSPLRWTFPCLEVFSQRRPHGSLLQFTQVSAHLRFTRGFPLSALTRPAHPVMLSPLPCFTFPPSIYHLLIHILIYHLPSHQNPHSAPAETARFTAVSLVLKTGPGTQEVLDKLPLTSWMNGTVPAFKELTLYLGGQGSKEARMTKCEVMLWNILNVFLEPEQKGPQPREGEQRRLPRGGST